MDGKPRSRVIEELLKNPKHLDDILRRIQDDQVVIHGTFDIDEKEENHNGGDKEEEKRD